MTSAAHSAGRVRAQQFAERGRAALPGAGLAALVSLGASFVALSYGGPPLLYALLLGIAFNYLAGDLRLTPGIDFCSKSLLRLGVGLLGARITASQVVSLGWAPVAIVIAATVTTILAGVALARRAGLRTEQGLLSGGAVAICGASAALAISAALPPRKESERFTLMVIVCVTILSTIAMVAYPLAAQLLDLPPALAGLFLGGTIHDVAQVVGAGYSMGPEIGDIAIVVKLLRVSLLVFVVAAIAFAFRNSRGDGHGGGAAPNAFFNAVPWFLWLFVAMVAINSAGVIPAAVLRTVDGASRSLLILAIAALGIKTSFSDLTKVGWTPVLLVLGETMWLAAFVLCAALSLR